MEETNVKITWEQYDTDVHKLAEMLKESKTDFHCIYGIPRGGLVIGAHLSHLLKIPLTDKPFGSYLVVDDVSDSGGTLADWRTKRMVRVKLATLYVKGGTSVMPDFWVAKYPKDKWIVYPWEI